MLTRICNVAPGIAVPGLGIPIPEKPDRTPNYDYKEPVSSLVREGNRAVPVQPMYTDVEE